MNSTTSPIFLRPGNSIPAKVEVGLEQTRVLVLCLSAEVLADDWPKLESHTFRLKSRLSKGSRFVPVRLVEVRSSFSSSQWTD